MSITGGTSQNWFLLNRDGAEEYREVSEDGTEENTKQQSRNHSTLVRERITDSKSGSAITAFATEEGTGVSNPAYYTSWGSSFTALGSYIIVSHQFTCGGRGTSKLIETQVLKLFGSYSDV